MASDDDDDDSVVYYLEDGKLHFTEEGLRHFTEEERGQLVELHEQFGKKSMKSASSWLSKWVTAILATLSAESKAQIVKEAEDLTEQWVSEPETSDDPKYSGSKASGRSPPFKHCSPSTTNFCERILDIQDDADARESRRRRR